MQDRQLAKAAAYRFVATLGVAVGGALIISACQQSPTAPGAVGSGTAVSGQALAVRGGEPKVDVCHVDDDGVKLISVSNKAKDAHLGHGDALPNAEGECDPVDPGVECPCFAALSSIGFTGDADLTCDPVTLTGSTEPGGPPSGDLIVLRTDSCDVIDDFTDVIHNALAISSDEFDACLADLNAFTQDLIQATCP